MFFFEKCSVKECFAKKTLPNSEPEKEQLPLPNQQQLPLLQLRQQLLRQQQFRQQELQLPQRPRQQLSLLSQQRLLSRQLKNLQLCIIGLAKILLQFILKFIHLIAINMSELKLILEIQFRSGKMKSGIMIHQIARVNMRIKKLFLNHTIVKDVRYSHTWLRFEREREAPEFS